MKNSAASRPIGIYFYEYHSSMHPGLTKHSEIIDNWNSEHAGFNNSKFLNDRGVECENEAYVPDQKPSFIVL